MINKSVVANLPFAGGIQTITPESHPAAWAYFHGSDLGGNLDQARMDFWVEEFQETTEARQAALKALGRDWHKPQQFLRDPPCGPTQWRTKNRKVVLRIVDLSDSHLGHCIRFARTRQKHAGKLGALLAELERRQERDIKILRALFRCG